MPGRKNPLITKHHYHVYNRGVAKQPTFTNREEFNRAINLIAYYQYANTRIKYSNLVLLSNNDQEKAWMELQKEDKKRILIHAFVLMNNHFHFVLEQVLDNGISSFISDFTNSYTKYVNTKNERVGPLFQGTFKAKPIRSDEQLLHLSRYIHLNPYTDHLVKTIDELINYKYSSLPNYIGKPKHDFVNTSLILDNFKRKNSYKRFVISISQYQRKLGSIKKLLMEKPTKYEPRHL